MDERSYPRGCTASIRPFSIGILSTTAVRKFAVERVHFGRVIFCTFMLHPIFFTLAAFYTVHSFIYRIYPVDAKYKKSRLYPSNLP